MFQLIGILVEFIKLILKILYYYITRIIPILLIIAIFLVLIGMIIKIGVKAGQAVIIIVAICIVFSYVLYGNKALDMFKKIYKKFATFFFYPLTSMLQKSSPESEEGESND